MYRVVVQDSRSAPTSGKFVALLGNYDPHNKIAVITKDKAELYLKNGAQPSDRVVKLFKSEKINLPKWVKVPADKKQTIRNPDKLRKNRPAEAVAEKPVEDAPAEVEATTEETSQETASTEEVKVKETSAESKLADTPAPEDNSAEPKAEDVEKDEEKTKTPPNEDEFPEDKKPDEEPAKA